MLLKCSDGCTIQRPSSRGSGLSGLQIEALAFELMEQFSSGASTAISFQDGLQCELIFFFFPFHVPNRSTISF